MELKPKTDTLKIQSIALVAIAIARLVVTYVIQHVWYMGYFTIGSGSAILSQVADGYMALLTTLSLAVAITGYLGFENIRNGVKLLYFVTTALLFSCGIHHIVYTSFLQANFIFAHGTIASQVFDYLKYVACYFAPIALTLIEFRLLNIQKILVFCYLVIFVFAVLPFAEEKYVSDCKSIDSSGGLFLQWIKRNCKQE